MSLLTDHIRKTIEERGIVEVKGDPIRSGWPVTTEEYTTPLEKRVQLWAEQNGWSCQHNSERDVYILRARFKPTGFSGGGQKERRVPPAIGP
jgi:hypothetical protein